MPETPLEPAVVREIRQLVRRMFRNMTELRPRVITGPSDTKIRQSTTNFTRSPRT